MILYKPLSIFPEMVFVLALDGSDLLTALSKTDHYT